MSKLIHWVMLYNLFLFPLYLEIFRKSQGDETLHVIFTETMPYTFAIYIFICTLE